MSHSSEPEGWLTASSGRIETNAIVVHGKRKTATGRAKLDLDRAGPRVARHIAKRLLRDPIEAKREGPGRLADVASRSEARWNSLDGAEPRTLGLQGLDQSEVFEDSGMQRVRERVHVLTKLDQLVTYRSHRLAGDRITQSLFLPSRIDCKQSQSLGNVIVQRVRQSGAFILVSGDQASVQVASFASRRRCDQFIDVRAIRTTVRRCARRSGAQVDAAI